MLNQAGLTNTKVRNHVFLEDMYQDTYFPDFLVNKCKIILLELCQRIETENPQNLEALYELSQASTDEINDLQEEFFENDSEIETGARECISMDFEFIAKAYGYDADIEELTATREW